MIVSLWGTESSSPMQALHFGNPIGGMISPLIALPFVTDGSNLNNDTSTDDRFPDDSQIEYAFAIVGLITIAYSALFFVFHFIKMPTIGHEVTKESKIGMSYKQVLSPSTWSFGRSGFGIVILVCMALFYSLHKGVGVSFGTYHALYAVDANFTTERTATVITASMNLVGTAARGLGIFLAQCISINVMVFTFVFGECMIAILMPLVGLKNLSTYWTFCCLFTFFKEPIWPSGYTWTDQYIILLAIIVGVADVAASLMDVLVGWLCGYLYTYQSMDSIFYLSLIIAIIFFLHVIIMNVYARPHGSRFNIYDHEDKDSGHDLGIVNTTFIDEENTDLFHTKL